MNSSDNPDSQILNEIIARFIQAREAGEAPNQEDILASHPDHAAALRAFFEEDAFLRTDASENPPIHGDGMQDSAAGDPTLAPGTGAEAIGTQVQYFGDYELLNEIARGGMGVVYRARQVAPLSPPVLTPSSTTVGGQSIRRGRRR